MGVPVCDKDALRCSNPTHVHKCSKFWPLSQLRASWAELVVIATPIINTTVCLPLWVLFGSGFSNAPLSEIAVQALYQGIVVSILATALFTICIRRAGALAASLAMAFVPILTPILAVLLIGEPLGTALIGIAAATSVGIAVYALGAFRFMRLQGQGGPRPTAKG